MACLWCLVDTPRCANFLLLLAVAGTLTVIVVERNELDGDDAITIAAMV